MEDKKTLELEMNDSIMGKHWNNRTHRVNSRALSVTVTSEYGKTKRKRVRPDINRHKLAGESPAAVTAWELRSRCPAAVAMLHAEAASKALQEVKN